MSPEIKSWLPTLIFAPLMALMLYRRTRRSFGRQKLERNRLLLRMGVLGLVGAGLSLTIHSVDGLIAGGAGLLSGVALGVVGLRHTGFESTPEGHFYTPHTYVGLAVTALLLARIASRVVTMSQVGAQLQATGAAPSDLQRSPLTFAIFFLMVGYYCFYYGGILRRLRGPV